MDESREQRIARLTEEFRKLLEEKFPEKGSTMQRIEELTEEIGKAIEEKIEDDATSKRVAVMWAGMRYANVVLPPGMCETMRNGL